MVMEWSSDEVLERAKEELEVLEAQHPHRFGFLKRDLKSFILLLQNSSGSSSSASISVSVSTKASTVGRGETRKKDRAEEAIPRLEYDKKASVEDPESESERVDLVLERARSCLVKIQRLKSSLCC